MNSYTCGHIFHRFASPSDFCVFHSNMKTLWMPWWQACVLETLRSLSGDCSWVSLTPFFRETSVCYPHTHLWSFHTWLETPVICLFLQIHYYISYCCHVVCRLSPMFLLTKDNRVRLIGENGLWSPAWMSATLTWLLWRAEAPGRTKRECGSIEGDYSDCERRFLLIILIAK